MLDTWYVGSLLRNVMIGAYYLVECFWLLMFVRSLLAWSRLWCNHGMGSQRSWVSLWKAKIRQLRLVWELAEAANHHKVIYWDIFGDSSYSYYLSASSAVCVIDSTGTAVLCRCAAVLLLWTPAAAAKQQPYHAPGTRYHVLVNEIACTSAIIDLFCTRYHIHIQ